MFVFTMIAIMENIKSLMTFVTMTMEIALIPCDAPPDSLMDSTTNPKVKTTEREKVGALPGS
jgi:hypothetical protein